MPEDDLKDFFDDSPDRATGIALPAILENQIAAMLKLVMRPDEEVQSDLFRSTGPLSAFGVKIRLAYMLGLIAKETYNDLQLIVRIRNAFAHDLSVKTFEDERISGRIRSLHIYKVMVALRDSHPFDPQREEPSSENLKAQILRDEMETMRSSFRMCVRMLIRYLSARAKELKAPSGPPAPHGSDLRA